MAHTYIAHIWQYPPPPLPRGYVVPKLRKISPLYNSHSLSPRWPLWRGSTVSKNTLEVSNYHVHLYVALLNLRFLFFVFRQKRLSKICLEQCWGRSSDVQKWLQQLRSSWSEGHHGHRKEITSCQVGLWTFIGNTLSGYGLNFRKRFSSGTFADTGQEVI